jgi:hypothetical protein
MPERDPMIEFWERLSWSDEHSETTRKFARRERNRLIYQSMTYKEAVLMVWEAEREEWTFHDEAPPSIWNVVSQLCNCVALNYGVVGAVSIDHSGDVLSDAFQIVLYRWHVRHGWEIHPDFLD